MLPFLILISCFQFLSLCVGLQQSPVYFILNPYVALAPLFLIWLAGLGFYRNPADKNFVILWSIMMGVQAMILNAFLRSNDFPFSFIRSMQFFWGPTLIIPMLLGLMRLAQPNDPRRLAQQFIKTLCIIAAGITLFEVIVVAVGVSPDALPWVTNIYKGPHRPFGLPAYPQPNAVFLALLFWLSFIWEVPGKFHRILVILALGATFGGTGQLTFLALLPLWTRKPFVFFFVALAALGLLMGGATIMEAHAQRGLLEKFDLAYLGILANVFIKVSSSLLSQFSTSNLLMGSSFISEEATKGLTHDWAYFDVFYVNGLIGLAGYILLYSVILYVACPRETSRQMRIYFALLVICANFHYGTLNYYIGQMLFSCLAALGIYRLYPIREKYSGAKLHAVNGTLLI